MNSPTFTLQTINNELVVVGSNGSQYPLSILDDYRLTSYPYRNQIELLSYNENLECWSYKRENIREGIDITKFVVDFVKNKKLQFQI